MKETFRTKYYLTFHAIRVHFFLIFLLACTQNLIYLQSKQIRSKKVTKTSRRHRDYHRENLRQQHAFTLKATNKIQAKIRARLDGMSQIALFNS